MANGKKKKGVIGILTGGGDCPGLNPAIRGVTFRALREGYGVIGIRKGWNGLTAMVRDKNVPAEEWYQSLTEETVRNVHLTGGTFLHTSRTNPIKVPKKSVPAHLQDKYKNDSNDLTPEVLQNLDFLGINYLVPIGGDDTLSYGVHLAQKGVNVVAIPKTMDNDVPATDYCLGFSTCVTRTLELTQWLRTCASSAERIMIIEVFGRYAGFTALVPALAGGADRCVIPEYKFNIERLTELLVKDRKANPSRFSIVYVSEGAIYEGGDMVFTKEETDMFGHKKLGGIGDRVADQIKELSAKFNQGKRIDVISQRLAYLVRCGPPDAVDSLVPMAWGNLALDLIQKNSTGRLVVLKDGCYSNVPITEIAGVKRLVDVDKFYDRERLTPRYDQFENRPFFIV